MGRTMIGAASCRVITSVGSWELDVKLFESDRGWRSIDYVTDGEVLHSYTPSYSHFDRFISGESIAFAIEDEVGTIEIIPGTLSSG